MDLSTYNPQANYTVGPYRFTLKSYFPDFALDEQGKPKTESNDPKKPAYIFSVTGPDLASGGDIYMYFPREIDKLAFRQDEINGELAKKLDISASSMNDVEIANYTSYLNIRKDLAVPYIWVGAIISIIGLSMGFYWNHRRIWLRIDNGILTLGAHTNKNWFGLRKETAYLLDHTGIPIDPKLLERRDQPS